MSAANTIDMTHGPIMGKMMKFAIPLIAGGVLQQSFNAVDVAVVGHYSTHQALGAVGGNTMVVSILINLFLGVSMGVNVVLANYIGQKDESGIRRSVSTAGALALLSGVLLMIGGICFARPILEAMGSPEDVIELATLYLEIFFLGMPFMMIYNFGAAIMRSRGDTRRPFYILVISGVVNTLLNLLLFIQFDMSVAGVATATVVANAVNAALMVRLLRREPEPYRLHLRHMRFHKNELRKILNIGVPAGLQGMVFSFANIFIQTAVNGYGSSAVAGAAVAVNYEFYCYFIISAFAQAAVAFTGQNFGAGLFKRCRRIFIISMALSVISSGVCNVLIAMCSDTFAGIFSKNADVLSYATIRLEYVLMFQWVACSYEIAGAVLRGLGYSMTPTVITLAGTCVLRLVWVYAVNPVFNSFSVLMTVYPLSWVLTGAVMVGAYVIITRRIRREAGA